MEDFNASLVREKITFQDEATRQAQEAAVVRSNRIYLRLSQHTGSTQGKTVEKVVVRAQNMHSTLRMASRLLFDFHQHGLFLGRATAFDWNEAWHSLLTSYEKDFNPNLWGAVYINGKAMFSTSASPFMDVIEKCALLTIDDYEAAMGVTETAFKKAGKAMKVSHSTNVATIITNAGTSTRCGIIHRTTGRDTTLNFTASGGEAPHRIVQSMGMAAAFLEGFNLRHIINYLQLKTRRGELNKVPREAAQLRAATARLIAVDKGITSFEEMYQVHYRPERPDFF